MYDQVWGRFCHPTSITIVGFVSALNSASWCLPSTPWPLTTLLQSTVASRLSTHPFKYALFSRKNRVQIYLVQHVMDCHMAQVLKILVFGFQGDNLDLILKRFKQLSKIIECFLNLFSNFEVEQLILYINNLFIK